MADDPGQAPSGQGQEPNPPAQSSNPSASPAPAVPAGAPPAGQAPPEETFDAAYVKKLREENAAARQKLRDQESRLTELDAKVKAADDAKLSEQERTQKRLSELEAAKAESERKEADWIIERQQLTTRHAVTVEAGRLGIVDADVAYKLIDHATLEYDDEGKPTNVAKVLAELVKAKPYLVGAPAASPTNPARSDPNAQGETPDQRRQRLYGGASTMFDPAAARSRGGGVFMPVETGQ